MSMIENLESIKKSGIKEFIKMKKYDGRVCNVAEPFVFTPGIVIGVEKINVNPFC